MENTNNTAAKVNWILLGLAMLIPGLIKLFVMGPAKIVGLMSGMGFPAATFLAWVLILSEIVFGVLILAKYKLNYTTIPPMIILTVAAFTFWAYGPGAAGGANWPQILVHLALASSYWVLGAKSK